MQRALVLRPKTLPFAAGPAKSRACHHILFRPASNLASLGDVHKVTFPEDSASIYQHSPCRRRFSSTGQYSQKTSSYNSPNSQRSKAAEGNRHKFSAPKSRNQRSLRPDVTPKHNPNPRRTDSIATITRLAFEKELEQAIQTLKLPTTKDVPNLPKKTFSSPVNALFDSFSILDGFSERRSRAGESWKHTLSVDDDTVGAVQGIGQGTTSESARAIAYLTFLAKLHENEAATKVFPVTHAVAVQEKHSILDVYLYAARYQDIPEMKVTDTRTRRGPSKEVTLTLPLLGITAIGRGRNAQFAEVSAGLNAKSALEQQIQKGSFRERQVKDEEVFGLNSAVAFCLWYRNQDRGITFDISSTGTNDGTNSSKVTIKDDTMEEPRNFPSVTSVTKKGAEELAQLVVAVTLTREMPELRSRFFNEYRRSNYQILAPLSPIDFNINIETVEAMQRAIDRSRYATDSLEEQENLESEESGSNNRGVIYKEIPKLVYERKSVELKRRQDAYEARDDLAELRKTRSEYPMNQYTEEVLETVKGNTYSIIIGATGSGKTTQVPQILLNDAIAQGQGAGCNIICTQPRRIAAKSVSQRVADERAEFIGDCVGYHVKKDVRLPSNGGSINFCTTGILAQQIQHEAESIMENVSHIIIDEVHERDTIIDFLMTALKRLVNKRLSEGKKVPHIILMSATIDADLFANYLQVEDAKGNIIKCPSLSVPGRTFPVREFYLTDVMKEVQGTGFSLMSDADSAKYIASELEFAKSNATIQDEEEDGQTINWAAERRKATAKSRISFEEQEQAMVPHALATSTIAHIANTTPEGAILTFLPGLEDITKINEMLRLKTHGGIDFTDESKFRIFMLHSSIQNTQREVFDPVPPGCRKIILATNIAETSITIPDVQHVVDTGKLRELQYDQSRRITKLACVWVSKSNAKQRAGRAGRVQDGNYYALYSKERYNSLRAVGLPELLRSDLQEVCLDIKNQGYEVPVREFLAETIEPPSNESVNNALDNLVSLQALDENETLTSLGKLLAQLPVHPSLGKMIVLGIIFRCLDPMLIIGSAFSERSLFVQPLDRRSEASEKKASFSRNTLSDHIGLLSAVKEMRMLSEVRGPRAMTDYALRNFLHIGAFKSIISTAETIETLLIDHRVIPRARRMDRLHFQFGDARLNENSDKVGLIKALILAGFYPNLSVRRGRIAYRTPTEANVLVHPGSVNGSRLKGQRNRDSDEKPKLDHRTELLSYSELVRSSDGNNMYLRDTTPVTALVAALFSNKLERTPARSLIKVDDWLPFYLADRYHVGPVLKLHSMLQRVTQAAFSDLAARRVLTDHEDRNQFADSLVEVLDSDLAYNATRTSGSRHFNSDTRRGDHTAAFAPTDRTKPKEKYAFGKRTEDPKQQELWDKLVASWAQRSNQKADGNSVGERRPSISNIFAEGQAAMKPRPSNSMGRR